MLPLQTKHVDPLDFILEDDFKDLFVQQIVQGRDSVFNEICGELNISDFQNIQAVNLNKRSVTEEKLIGWLETVCYVLNSVSVPALQSAVPILEQVKNLKNEKIEDQSTIIKLQQQLIEEKDDELEAVGKTVQNEMLSYFSVVSKSSSATLAPKKIEAAVKKVAEKRDRSRNLMIYGVTEVENEYMLEKVEEVLEEIGERLLVNGVCRIGVRKRDTIRPVKFSLPCSDQVKQVLRCAK